MPPWLHDSLFALVALSVLYGMHRYAWKRLVRDTRLEHPWRIVSALALALLGACVPVAFVVGLDGGADGARGLPWLAWAWFGFLYYCVLGLASFGAVRWLGNRLGRARERAPTVRGTPERPAPARGAPELRPPAAGTSERHAPVRSLRAPGSTPPASGPFDPSRRVFLSRAVAGGALLGAGGITARGLHSATGEILTPEISVRLARLPRELSGYRIVQLSDLHLGPLIGARFLESVVEKTNAQRPDLVVVTGDLVDGTVERLAREMTPLSRLAARDGVVFVTGNHEYYSGAEPWIAHLRSVGWTVLQNQRIEIGSGRASFDLAGVPDLRGGSFLPGHAPDLERALAGRDPERELVLLAHQPAQIEAGRGRGVGLQLSGHTHGGQMWPFGALVGLVQPYVRGLHEDREGSWIYVSRGTGFWGPPLRVAEPAEIATIVLVAGR